MPAINRIPHGLLSFLGIKNGGRNPQVLSEQLAANFDLMQWYLQQNSESLSVNAAVNALGFNGNYWLHSASGHSVWNGIGGCAYSRGT